MPIYTRTGDKGTTSLFDGSRVSKATPRVETYASVDELNSSIGVVVSHLKSKHAPVKKELQKIQHELFDIGLALAMPHPMPVVGLKERTEAFEKLIDSLTKKMPELKNFILPGGGKAGSLIHVSRTLARRAERRVVHLINEEEVDEHILKYLNRLSDLLFTMARYTNHLDKQKEIKWIKK
jgi:cob(I)alamin adenosyltransferase